MARPAKFRLTPDDVLDPQNARKLVGHVAEIEFFRGEVEKLQAQIAGIYDAADDDGFDKKFIRKVVAIRAKDETVAQAEQIGIDAYTEALEIGFRSRAREENPEHDANGVIIESTAARKDVQGQGQHEVGSSSEEGPRGHAGAGTQAPPVDTIIEPQAGDGNARPVPVQTGGLISAPAASAGQVAVASPASHITDLTKPNPICRDPKDCGIYASWHLPCESCKRAAVERRAA